MHKLAIGALIGTAITFLMIVVVVVLTSPSWMVQTINEERALYLPLMSEQKMIEVVEKADEKFASWRPLTEKTQAWFYIEEDEMAKKLKEASRGTGEAVSWWTEKLIEAHDTAWNLIYQSVQRFYIFLLFAPMALVLFLAASIDGLMNREIKKTDMSYSSPLKYNLAFIGIFAGIFIFFLLFFQPFNVPYIFMVSLALFLALSVRTVFTHLQKKV